MAGKEMGSDCLLLLKNSLGGHFPSDVLGTQQKTAQDWKATHREYVVSV